MEYKSWTDFKGMLTSVPDKRQVSDQKPDRDGYLTEHEMEKYYFT